MLKKFAVLVLAFMLCLGVFSGCTSQDIERLDIFEYEKYSEDDFRKEISTKGDGDIALSEASSFYYNYIYYPNGIDDFEVVNGKYENEDRYKVELYNSVKFFKQTLEKMTGANNIKIAPISTLEKDYKSIILKIEENENIKNDGYKKIINENNITFISKTTKGLCNAIFDFLESDLGCMFATQNFDYIPSLPTIYLTKGEKVVEPSIAWRDLYSHEIDYNYGNADTDYFNVDYLGWNTKTKVNGAGYEDWYNFVHTSFSYISPEEYYDEHPEYFTLFKGKRTYTQGPVSGQLCWTNEDVYQIIKSKVFQQMRENPDKHIWDISQMDTWESKGIGCECDKCKAIDEREGSYMGSLLTFINRLADDVKEVFPNNYVSTLAYNYTQDPPKNIKPRDNVIIKLCLMPGNLADSYKNPTQKDSLKAHELVNAWGKIAENVVIWDYNVNYKNYLMPFPIYRYMEENQQFYIDNNVYGIFHQMDRDKGGASAEMNAYMYAKLMWNQDLDLHETMNKYLTVTYGDAAPYMAKYYSDLDYNLQKSGKRLYLYNMVFQHRTGFLSVKNINNYLDTFEKALDSVKGNQDIVDRINREKTSVLFVKVEQFHLDQKGRAAALEELMQICEKEGIIKFAEASAHQDQIQAFYDRNNAEIKATPAIIIAFILIPIVIGAIIYLIIVAFRKSKGKKLKALEPPAFSN